MFESWPFTNFHDMNLDWIIKTIKTYTKKVDDLYNFGLYDFVEKVLEAHPEWTTTVQDGAISEPKLADDSVSTRTIRDGAVTEGKLNEDVLNKIINNSNNLTAGNLTTINNILELARPYMDDNTIVYDSGKSPFYYGPGSTGHGLTCSDWCIIAMYGMKYDQLKWFGGDNTISPMINSMEGLLELKYQGAWSEQLARYIEENNLGYIPNDDMSNVSPGDIIFYDLDPTNDNDPMYYPPTGETTTRYKGVDHSSVFVYKPNDDYYTVLEIASSGPVILYNTGIGNRKMVCAIRNPWNNLETLPETLFRENNPTVDNNRTLHVRPARTINKGEFVSVVIEGLEMLSSNYLAISAHTTGGSWVTQFSQSSMQYKVYESYKKAVMLFRATDDIDRFDITAADQSGGTITMTAERLAVYAGLNYTAKGDDVYQKINNPLALAKVDDIKNTITPTSGANWAAYGGCYYFKLDKTVYVHIAVESVPAANTTYTIGWLPDGFKPAQAIVATVQANDFGNMAYIRVNPSGSIQIRTGNTFIAGEVSFAANS